jgi:hypothetical protein
MDLFILGLITGEIKNGGADENRTRDLIVANDALSQLSYSPNAFI